jgi:formylglycine-generating enzyme required for sulfatase activity
MIPPDEIIPSGGNELTPDAGGSPVIKRMVNDLIALARKNGEQAPATRGSPWTVPDLSLEMLWCKPGAFQMGSPEEEEGRYDDETLHTVTLTEGYWLGKHPVTQAQWEKVMGENPSELKGEDRPVGQVTWADVTSFCEKLTEQESEADRLPAGMSYQLPTEAQWEYACRAETTTAYAFGDSLTSDQANIDGGPDETTDVGKYPPNAWDFHDMHGNVDEWCADWYEENYPTGNVTNPTGPADGSFRVRRGGSWYFTADDARSANRSRLVPALSSHILGFRLSLRPPASKAEPQVQEKESVAVSVNAGTAITIRDLGLDMLWVKPGTFEMGSPPEEEDRRNNETQHTVTLTEGYWLGKYPVTQAQWEKVMGDNPSHFKGADRPVETASWDKITSFCERLTERERKAGRLPAGMAYQLPTEAQWEYACRAGTTTAFSFGDKLTEKDANYAHDGFGTGLRTSNVGEYASNLWGFHDMHGNVWEWTADWYEEYTSGAVSDPVGPAGVFSTFSTRVRRGGSWINSAYFARSAYRKAGLPAYSDDSLGFRLSLRPASQ